MDRAGLGHIYSCLFNEMVSQSVSHLPTGWPHDHGPTNVRAMVKSDFKPIQGGDQKNVTDSDMCYQN